jgi:shikimate dehydrogenase
MRDERRAFVMGWPIGHSRSPLIHGHWLRRYGIPGSYSAEPVRPEDAPEFLRNLGPQGYAGGNVTVPHKEAAFAICDRLSPVADKLGAVNTVWVEAGKLHGDNTDAYGFAANLDERAPGWRNGRNALVLGAGGAARAVIFALQEAGFREIRIVNRTVQRARDLAVRFGAPAVAGPLAEAAELLPAADLVVNATSAGLSSEAPLPLDWSKARAGAIATDLIYTPLMTPFLRAADAAGLTIVDGLGMLLYQAVPGFERWFGRRPEVDRELRALIEADIERSTG